MESSVRGILCVFLSYQNYLKPSVQSVQGYKQIFIDNVFNLILINKQVINFNLDIKDN